MASPRVPEILSLGHSTQASHDFLARLDEARVELLVDVRRHPGSRRVPWTSARQLASLLAGKSIGYLHLAALGGRRRPGEASANGAWRNTQFQGYADHMGSADFAAGFAELEAEARQRRAAIMCAEAQWWRCHRRLLSDLLVVRGWRVLHLDLRGGSTEHELTPFALVEGTQVRYPPAAVRSGPLQTPIWT
jgi:uncharacterized protein (DUF488 family)